MENLRKTLVGAALAGMLVTSSFSTPAFAGGDNGDERKNGEVDVVVKYHHHGEWKTKEYEDVELKKAASIAKDKADGGDWHKYYRDAKYTDRTDKSVKTVDKKWVKVIFEQDEDNGHGHGHKG